MTQSQILQRLAALEAQIKTAPRHQRRALRREAEQLFRDLKRKFA